MYDKRPYFRTILADVDVIGTYCPVSLGVDRNTDPLEVLARIGPYFARVLANASRKYHGVCPVRGGGHCGDLRPKTMKIDIDRQDGCRVPTRPMLKQFPHIAGKAARERQETAPPLEGIGKFVGCDAMGCDPRDSARIYIARARRHHEPLGRGEPHSGVNRATTCGGGHRGTAAQVADHESEGIDGTFQERGSTTRGPLATEPVEAVAPQAPLFDPRLTGARKLEAAGSSEV